MELGQFGDTEIAVTDIKNTVEKLKQCTKENGGMCKLQEEFEVSFELKLTINLC